VKIIVNQERNQRKEKQKNKNRQRKAIIEKVINKQ
jgi:hypothetical protein